MIRFFKKISGANVDRFVSEDNPLPIGFVSDTKTGKLQYASLTLSATANTITTVDVPSWARGFRIFPNGNPLQFAVGENPAILATIASTDQAITTDQLQVGGIAKKDAWETRLLEDGSNRQVRLRSATASLVVEIEFFG